MSSINSPSLPCKYFQVHESSFYSFKIDVYALNYEAQVVPNTYFKTIKLLLLTLL